MNGLAGFAKLWSIRHCRIRRAGYNTTAELTSRTGKFEKFVSREEDHLPGEKVYVYNKQVPKVRFIAFYCSRLTIQLSNVCGFGSRQGRSQTPDQSSKWQGQFHRSRKWTQPARFQSIRYLPASPRSRYGVGQTLRP